MEINFDEDLLLLRKVDTSYNEPVLNQVLRIAIYDEYLSYETYRKIIDIFGDQKPFSHIMEEEVKHYTALIVLLEKYNVPVPIDNWYEKVKIPSTLLECCEVAVAAEIHNIDMYDNLLLYTAQYPDVTDVLYKLQASSYNNHLPTFRKCVQTYSGVNVSGSENTNENMKHEEMAEKMNEFTQMAQKMASGQMSQEDMMKILGSTNMAFAGGILAGGLGASILPKLFKKEEEK